MSNDKSIEIAGEYLLDQSLKERANKTEFTERESIWENFYEEVRNLGYDVHVFIQLQSCVAITKDKRLLPIILKYIDIFEKRKHLPPDKPFCGSPYSDYVLTISFLEDLADKSITEYVIERFKKEEPRGNGGAKFRWGEVLLKISDSRHVQEYLSIISCKEHVIEGTSIFLLLSKLKVYDAIPILFNILNCNNENIVKFCRNRIITAFGNYKLPELKKHIEPYLTDKDSYTRNIAKAAMAKIERAEAKQQQVQLKPKK